MAARILRIALLIAAATAATLTVAGTMPSGKPEYMLVGIDNKVVFADDGSVVVNPPGADLVAIVDIGTDPEHPKIVTRLLTCPGFSDQS